MGDVNISGQNVNVGAFSTGYNSQTVAPYGVINNGVMNSGKIANSEISNDVSRTETAAEPTPAPRGWLSSLRSIFEGTIGSILANLLNR